LWVVLVLGTVWEDYLVEGLATESARSLGQGLVEGLAEVLETVWEDWWEDPSVVV
jgi:hypothetical protein